MPTPLPTHDPNAERRVSRVAFQAHDQSRVNVFVDGRFAFAISAVEAVQRGLKPGRALTADDIDELRQLEELERARLAAVSLLSVRPRSRRELRDRLTRKGLPAEVVERVVEEMARRGYVDDDAFARYWVENRQANRPRGQRALVAELRAKGVDADAIEAAVAPTADGEEASALALARRRARTLREPDPRRFRQRLGAFLQRKGYAYDTVRTVVQTVLAEQGASDDADGDDDDPAEQPS
jgi:regulatory protein